MGIFTWTDAAVKDPKEINEWGDYDSKDIVEYGGYAKLICPDDTEIETECHSMYGLIQGYDIYELFAEWNRADLPKSLNWGDDFKVLVKMFAQGKRDEDITRKASEIFGDSHYLVEDWKRNIGIFLEEVDAKKIKYPIKLTKDRNAHGYNNLYVSYSTQ